MLFTPASLAGVHLVDVEKHEDERGYFARTWCVDEFEQRGLNPRLVQASLSFNRRRGTLRGMHLQVAPHEEAKLVRCVRGAIYDVVVDLRSQSPTYRQWFGTILSEHNCRMLYICEGLAHGFQTLEPDTEVVYQISESFHPESARGYRWDDPAFSINWPDVDERILSERDRSYPYLDAPLG